MENILITNIEPKFGKPNAQGQCTPFWACSLSDGTSATIWDEELKKTAESNIGKPIQAEIKTSPAGHKNIRAIIADGTAPQSMPETPQSQPQPQTSVNPQRVGLFIKLAVEMMIASPQEGKNVEENLCENIQEIKKLEEFTVKLLSE